MRKSMTLIITCLAFFVILLSRAEATSFRSARVGYNAFYESNIFHSYEDTSETGDMLNVLDMKAHFRFGSFRRFYFDLRPNASFDLYASNPDRNKSSIWLGASPVYRYRRHARIYLDLDGGRRNKDLIDDAGNVLSRTLAKWEFNSRIRNRIDLDNVRLEQSLAYDFNDYDETAGLKSYDYHSWLGELDARTGLKSRLKVRLRYEFEKRYYKERRTYTVQFGAVIGRPYEIRNFLEHTFEGGIRYALTPSVEVGAEIQYATRKDNFENFYGFSHWQYRANLAYRFRQIHEFEIQFRFKNKDYENYHTSRIGTTNRVWIDYADFKANYKQRIDDNWTLTAYFQNYNKVSNDPSFDYRDVTSGVGFEREF